VETGKTYWGIQQLVGERERETERERIREREGQWRWREKTVWVGFDHW